MTVIVILTGFGRFFVSLFHLASLPCFRSAGVWCIHLPEDGAISYPTFVRSLLTKLPGLW